MIIRDHERSNGRGALRRLARLAFTAGVAFLPALGCGSSDDSSTGGAIGGSSGGGAAGTLGNGGTGSSTGGSGVGGSGNGGGATGGGGTGGASGDGRGGDGRGGAAIMDAALDARNGLDSGASDAGRASDAGSAGRDGPITVDAGAGATDASTASCDTRRNGAVIDFRICNQSLRLFVTNATFITEAQRLQGNGQARIACFPMMQDGRDCDPTWTWHSDPSLPYWTDFELETYFACPADVEKDKVDWVQQIGQYCGEMTTVTAVRDNR